MAYDLNYTHKGLFVSGLQVMLALCSPLQLLQLRKVKVATNREINQVSREVSQQTLDFMLLLGKKGTVRDSNGNFGRVVPPPAPPSPAVVGTTITNNHTNKNKSGGKSQHSKHLSVVGSCAVKWKKSVKYGKRLQENNYCTSMMPCCNKRDIVVPRNTVNYFRKNSDNNNNNHTNNTTNTNFTIQRNNNNNNNQSNNSSAMYFKNNEGYEYKGLMVGMGEMS